MEEVLVIWIQRLPFVASFCLFIWIVSIHYGNYDRRVLRACEELSGYLVKKSKETDWYHRTKEFLCKNGASFHFGQWVQPISWLVFRIVIASFGGMAGLALGWRWTVIPMVAGFCLPDMLLRYLNFRDNEKMLAEIKLIYHGLEIQLRAGVYITDALVECYAGVEDVRLRQALLDLAGEIAVKADVYEALSQFQRSFDNRYIDALCITLIQALESGQAVELLRDIAEQVKDMEVSVMERKKAALDRSVTFYQLGILAAVLGIVLYACVTQMFASAINF